MSPVISYVVLTVHSNELMGLVDNNKNKITSFIFLII